MARKRGRRRGVAAASFPSRAGSPLRGRLAISLLAMGVTLAGAGAAPSPVPPPSLAAFGRTAPAPPMEPAAERTEQAVANISFPPPEEVVLAAVRRAWPEDPETAERVLVCESRAGQDPATYDHGAENGGPLQLNRSVWEPFFQAEFGWTWDRILTDLDLHVRAARVVYERSGWGAWDCY